MINNQKLEQLKIGIEKCKNVDELKSKLSASYLWALQITECGRSFLNGNNKFLNPQSQILDQKLDLRIGITGSSQREKIFAGMNQAQKVWANLDLEKRIEILRKFVELMRAKNIEEYLIFTLMLELGKDAASAKSEIAKTVEYLNYYTDKNFAELLASKTDKGITLERRPRGIVGIITSANYPIALSMPAIMAGLCSGNAVIIKPTTKAMLWSFMIKELFVQAAGKDFANLFQIVIGYELDFYKQVDSLFFVGSEETGKMIRRERFNYRLENNLLENGTDIFELGGISPAIILKSHQEIEDTAKAIFAGATGNSGQRCTATKILLIEDGADEGLVNNLTVYFESFDKALLNIPFVEGVKFGPIFDENVITKMQDAKDLAAKFGLKAIGGELVERLGGGKYITPLLVDATGLQDEEALKFIFECEIFGPVVFMFRNIAGIEDVISLCQLIDQPLSCGIFCNDEELKIFRSKTNFGSVNHNKTAKDLSPFGSHGARFRSGGSTNDALSMVNALTYPVSYNA